MKNWEKRFYKTLNVLMKMLKCRKVSFRCSFMGHKTSLPLYKTKEVKRKDPTTIEKQICVCLYFTWSLAGCCCSVPRYCASARCHPVQLCCRNPAVGTGREACSSAPTLEEEPVLDERRCTRGAVEEEGAADERQTEPRGWKANLERER